MKMIARIAAFASLGLLCAMPFGASTNARQSAAQTPENAHRFLIQLSGQGRLQFTVASNYTEFTSYSSHGNNGQYRIARDVYTSNQGRMAFPIDSSAKCLTRIKQVYPDTLQEYSEEPGYPAKGNRPRVPGDKTNRVWLGQVRTLQANGVDWSRISKTETSGDGVILRGGQLAGGSLTLYFESAEMATRAAFAIEVIRQSCDPVSNTGF